ncbi:hypothetical protein [Streptomyces sp. Go-475]|uniref:hypothetical protein n=1 Tax=Streptomyces sp. Go-475 TaxID=2072505 RepID=UPI000DF00882|nr:hypothetical protein [Streptomyces sp. Go-475]AXE87846.1 hypothetical protein C1703_22860 [Streptomyces sp. Go-475]
MADVPAPSGRRRDVATGEDLQDTVLTLQIAHERAPRTRHSGVPGPRRLTRVKAFARETDMTGPDIAA